MMGCTAGCARVVLISLNFIFWLAGAAILGIGIWMKVDSTIVNFLQVVNVNQQDPLLYRAAWHFMAVGAFVFILGLIGCCGALKNHQGLLFAYAFLVLMVISAEIAAGVTALLYRKRIEENLEESMKRQIQVKYQEGAAIQIPWDYLQEQLKCCGVENSTDYIDSNWWNNTAARTTNSSEMHYVPDKCCKDPTVGSVGWKMCQKDAKNKASQSDYLFTEGCLPELKAWFDGRSLIFMIIGFAVGGIQIIGFIAACCLRNALKGDPKDYPI